MTRPGSAYAIRGHVPFVIFNLKTKNKMYGFNRLTSFSPDKSSSKILRHNSLLGVRKFGDTRSFVFDN